MARQEPVFEVFARISPGDPMSHIGTLNAPGIELARVYAWRIYDEEDWSEMWVAPRNAIVSAHPDQAETATTDGGAA
jgi:1,2-phenylacetyl-CoA epoxidase PaaB subunit